MPRATGMIVYFHRLFISLAERRRSPSAHLVRRRCGTLCSGCYFGCSAVPFLNPGIRFAVGPSRRSYPGIIIIIPNVSVHPRRTLCAVVVERLVGSHFHWLFLASLSEIVPAGVETILSLWWRVR